MHRQKLFLEFFVSIVVLGVLNFLATKYNWYWTNDYFDSMMHFLGGVMVALFFMWLYFYSGWFVPPSRNLTHFFCATLLCVIFVAVSWEVYELLLGEAKFNAKNYRLDTTLDFIMDTLGALAAILYGYLSEIGLSAKNIRTGI